MFGRQGEEASVPTGRDDEAECDNCDCLGGVENWC